jgi:hypothetical protein
MAESFVAQVEHVQIVQGERRSGIRDDLDYRSWRVVIEKYARMYPHVRLIAFCKALCFNQNSTALYAHQHNALRTGRLQCCSEQIADSLHSVVQIGKVDAGQKGVVLVVMMEHRYTSFWFNELLTGLRT